MNRFFGHLKNVTIHRFRVFEYSLKVGIPLNGLKHDLSKFSYTEFSKSIKYYQGTSSPVFAERKENLYYSNISIHHTNRNRHHFEYWIDVFKGSLVLSKMPYKFAVEYCIDMISASKTYMKKDFKLDSVLNYFNERKSFYLMHPATKEFVTSVLEEFSKNGRKNLKSKRLKKLYNSVNEKYNDTYFVLIDLKNGIKPIEKFEGFNFII